MGILHPCIFLTWWSPVFSVRVEGWCDQFPRFESASADHPTQDIQLDFVAEVDTPRLLAITTTNHDETFVTVHRVKLQDLFGLLFDGMPDALLPCDVKRRCFDLLYYLSECAPSISPVCRYSVARLLSRSPLRVAIILCFAS